MLTPGALLTLISVLFGIIGAACTAAWVIARAINGSAKEVRDDLGGKIEAVGDGLHKRMDRLDDRVDAMSGRITVNEQQIRGIKKICEERHHRKASICDADTEVCMKRG